MRNEQKKGYVIAAFDFTDMLEVERDDSMNVFEDDEQAVEAAVADGIKIIPVDELPEDFDRRYYGWIDTPENRWAIQRYSDEHLP